MSIGDYNNMNYNHYSQIYFRNGSSGTPILTKPIEKVENVINTTVDTFVKTEESEEKKTSHKTAIAVGSSVLVLSAVAAMLNPKFSGKLINKLKMMSHKAGTKAQKNNGNTLRSKFFNTMSKFWKGVGDIFQFTNTLNAGKDIGFKWLCTKEKTFGKVKNKTARTILQKCDAGFRYPMAGIHKSLTSWFDSISRKTVQNKYMNASKKLDALEDLVNYYKTKLPSDKQKILEQKLQEIKTAREYFSDSSILERLNRQEKLMSNLEADLTPRYKQYAKDLWKGNKKKKKTIKDNMSFWAEDILMPQRNKLEQEGQNVVSNLVGDIQGHKGKYNEIADIITPYLSKDEAILLGKKLGKADKSLHKANLSETVEYFDKKRDLMLGGAPTDILSGLAMVGLSGVAIGSCSSKDERIQKAITTGFPAIAGIGTSMALTAMLFSGAKSLILGSIAGAVFSLLGSGVNKVIYPKQKMQNTELLAVTAKQKEVLNA